jgi:hypothetical protein
MCVNGTDVPLEVFSAMETFPTSVNRTNIQSAVILVRIDVGRGFRGDSSAPALFC